MKARTYGCVVNINGDKADDAADLSDRESGKWMINRRAKTRGRGVQVYPQCKVTVSPMSLRSCVVVC